MFVPKIMKLHKNTTTLVIKPTTKIILNEIHSVLDKINEQSFAQLFSSILDAKNIFVTGQGRSGLVSRTFAMRLTHIGLNAYCVGDATTPNIDKGDLLIACSSSGNTHITCYIAELAKKSFATVAAITSQKNSPLTEYADIIVDLPVQEIRTHNKINGSIQFRSTLFEQACLVYLDGVIHLLVTELRSSEQEMNRRHSNLE
ncbi:6-phospho-3-hexuloisomerase [Candidatus Kuenenia stuttgartiensis]|uniref:6-phospho-3-hexuloisomerase n=1 Tax=Kuenenia stuttgartiensis TaxID=174633 RepID=Q1Q5Y0_KUEST|nr:MULTISPECIES: 6-phospho-3-hexuloisomerase [Kuenenia]MBE7549147.1 6-phospho-3-hexuloisomerase [Planctomycetia bacterium]MBW7942013.1 6-phospho-3-hexuloisomerase [Candidatus Kuenenia stuttgartiensis]MBZ0190124.1 6-phospho-3-hexuloisomerase [Candidatus Kuenenia stuttgartiensis]MCL4728459.1 6-phospho-3-hexuloisomerase [Candidatus Kuenenia stuttgartiensis]MCZ7624027.1 6-phospho-3-hexuloisomerase [Candidatus Kuenenia sp.]